MTDERLDKDQFAATLDLSSLSSTRRPDATLEPTMAPRFRRDRRRESLGDSKRALASIEGTGNTIRIKSPLAEGGMGQILLAEQGGLRREVAAKTLKDEFLERDFAERLTREARVTGLVEHPNIVPVYALQNDDRGAPLMVMKRIEGVSWRTIIRDPAHPMLENDRGDLLEWHLRVVTNVCDALSFAHSRGILHLDVKPDNVMVGAFRDVYLVDWGVASSMREEHRGFLPMVDETTEILGTPAYLAPEVVDPKLARIGPRTDVFLIGATLFEALTKSPPYRGETVRDILYEAYLAKPPVLPDSVPQELAAIVRRAMSHKPDDRFESPDAVRRAIERFLKHRTSTKLVEQSLAELDAIAPTIDAAADLSPKDLARALRRFSECRFGFAQALREWPENPDALDGMSAATVAIARFHLNRGEHASAASVLDELAVASERFADQIAAFRETIREGRDDVFRLREIREHHDDARSRVARAYYVLAMVGFLVLPMFVGWGLQQVDLYRWMPWHSVVYMATLFVVGMTGAFLMRRTLMPNRVSRRIVISFGFITTAIFFRKIIAFQLGHVGLADVSMDMYLFGMGIGVVGLLTDRRFFGVATSCMCAGFFIALFPEHAMLLIGIAGVLGPVSTALLWLQSDRDARRSSGRRGRESFPGAR